MVRQSGFVNFYSLTSILFMKGRDVIRRKFRAISLFSFFYDSGAAHI